MTALRAFFLHHRRLAAVLVMAALCMKALVPAGYMLGQGARTLTVEICADSIGQRIVKQITVPQSGHSSEKDKGDSPCHFTALGHAALGGADPVLLALALVFIMAMGFAALQPAAPRRVSYLRPPLRGPPIGV
jgi:hypothetical protein